MAENLVVNGVRYDSVEQIHLKNADGESVTYYPETYVEEQKNAAVAAIPTWTGGSY